MALLENSPANAVTIAAKCIAVARLFEAIVELLEWASFDRPLMLLIEDIHVADAASLELAAYAGRRLGRVPVLMILTRRDLPRPAGVDALEHALRARGVLRLELSLGPLPALELQRLVSSVASLGPEDVDRVVAASDGNPLPAMESARALAASKARRSSDSIRSRRQTLTRLCQRLSRSRPRFRSNCPTKSWRRRPIRSPPAARPTRRNSLPAL